MIDEQQQRPTETSMNAPLPVRPRRKLLTPATATLLALATAAGGFYAGVRIEKSRTSSSVTVGAGGSGATSGFASRLRALLGGRGAGAAGGGSAGGGAGGAAGGLSGLPSAGTVASVSRNAIYVTEFSGNTVKVTLSSATQVSKRQTVSRRAIRPGDTVTVQGVSSANGTLAATTVNDSGIGGGGLGGAAAALGGGGAGAGGVGASGGGAGGGAAALRSLFQSGG